MADGFHVDLERLTLLTEEVDAVVIRARSAVAAGPAVPEAGHPALSAALTEFDTRWLAGLGHLMADSEGVADRLNATGEAYRAQEARVAADLAEPLG